jgi:hypothetical protein
MVVGVKLYFFWSEAGEHKVFGPNILQEAEKQVRLVRENL